MATVGWLPIILAWRAFRSPTAHEPPPGREILVLVKLVAVVDMLVSSAARLSVALNLTPIWICPVAAVSDLALKRRSTESIVSVVKAVLVRSNKSVWSVPVLLRT